MKDLTNKVNVNAWGMANGRANRVACIHSTDPISYNICATK